MISTAVLWLLQAVLVVRSQWVYEAGSESEAIRDTIPAYMEDPEVKPENIFAKESYVQDFKKRIRGEDKFTGYMYAGRAEFPWIVDVRFNAPDDYELYSTGNIVTKRHVITVCRTLIFANFYRKEMEDELGEREFRFEMHLIQDWVEMKVVFCANFEWLRIPKSDRGRYAPDVRREYAYEGGEIGVNFISSHPKCRLNALVYDFASLVLRHPVMPVPPILSYIPIFFDQTRSEIMNLNIEYHIENRKMCFIGTFGRPYVNTKRPPTLDYKVKFRIYYTSWSECNKIWNLLGDPVKKGIGRPYWCIKDKTCQIPQEDKKFLTCFNSRARVGSVCDHDRGSPVVCSNQVYGFITRGAQLKFCSNTIHVPFIVVKITAVRDYFKVTNPSKFYMPRQPSTRKSQPVGKGRRDTSRGAAISKTPVFLIIGPTIIIFTGSLSTHPLFNVMF